MLWSWEPVTSRIFNWDFKIHISFNWDFKIHISEFLSIVFWNSHILSSFAKWVSQWCSLCVNLKRLTSLLKVTFSFVTVSERSFMKFCKCIFHYINYIFSFESISKKKFGSECHKYHFGAFGLKVIENYPKSGIRNKINENK